MIIRQARTVARPRLHTRLSAAVSGLLCFCLAAPPALAGAPGRSHTLKKSRTAARPTPLTSDQRTLQALHRFTFGPRPGDVQQVNDMGLEAWFDRQLHPDRIPDTALDARLASFPAMQLTQAELLQRFPTPGMLRQYSNGKLGAPPDPTERAIYADASFSYEEKRANKAANTNKAAAVTVATTIQPGTGTSTAATASDKGADAGSPAADAEPAMDPAEVQQIVVLPPDQRMARLLSMTPEQVSSLRLGLKGAGGDQALLRGLSPEQTEAAAALQAPRRVVSMEVLATRLLRDVYSERQLQAVMTDFWLNHFNVYDRKNQDEPYMLPTYERQVVLPNALGRFEDLLVATAQSPAMLIYLDNASSVGPDSKAAERRGPGGGEAGNTGAKPAKKREQKGINENYARELMELHTLGVNGGYTQDDVIEVAKCFTGWTVNPPAQGGEFRFNPNRHEPGDKMVLGHRIPGGGGEEGLAVLHLLAQSPQTAHFLSTELAYRFVSDTPPPALVDRMTKAYLEHDGNISAVLSAMFQSPEFWTAEVYKAKVKTPIEFMASALRASDAEVSNPMPLVNAMAQLGMPIYGMQTPNGYSWKADAGVSSSALITRLNFALVLSGNRLGGTRIDWGRALDLGDPTLDPPMVERKLEQALLGEPAAPKTRAAVLAQAADPASGQRVRRVARGLAAETAAISAGARYRIPHPRRTCVHPITQPLPRRRGCFSDRPTSNAAKRPGHSRTRYRSSAFTIQQGERHGKQGDLYRRKRLGLRHARSRSHPAQRPDPARFHAQRRPGAGGNLDDPELSDALDLCADGYHRCTWQEAGRDLPTRRLRRLKCGCAVCGAKLLRDAAQHRPEAKRGPGPERLLWPASGHGPVETALRCRAFGHRARGGLAGPDALAF